MNNKYESRLSMYLTFKDFQANYTAITNSLPNYAANSTVLLNTIVQIQSIAEQQGVDKKGVTEEKRLLKENLVVLTADCSRKLAAYAKFTSNSVLAGEVRFSESKLRQSADTVVRDYAKIVYNRAQSIVASLATYGITAATQTTLLNAINSYAASIGKPGLSKVEKMQVNKQLDALFRSADVALANMDAAVEIVRLSQPVFYNGYKKARRITVTGRGSLSLKGMVADAASGQPLKGVLISFAPDGNPGKEKSTSSTAEVVKKTADKGGFYVKSLPAGIYSVTVSKNGYKEQTIALAVSDGEMSELDVQLEKN